MRSHAEMRDHAHEVLNSYESRDINETMLARDVLDLLDELGDQVPTSTEEQYHFGSPKEALIMASALIAIVPALLLGKYVAWWLGAALWGTESLGYLFIDLNRNEPKSRWWAVFVGLFALVYGPILLVYELLRLSRFGKYLLAHSS